MSITVTLHSPGEVAIEGGGINNGVGKVTIVSNGKTVRGTFDGAGTSAGHLNTGATETATGGLEADIVGSVAQPKVIGTVSGVESDVGAVSSPFAANLNVTQASCSSISGDAVKMFADEYALVSKDITIGGSAMWTARRIK